VKAVAVYEDAIRIDTPSHNTAFDVDEPDDSAIKQVTGHEVGHLCNMSDYNYTGTGGRITVMISGFFGWVNANWTNIPSTYDQVDLSLLQIR
jgi:hypothetical protein